VLFGWIQLFSLLFLSFDVAAILSINEKDTFGDIARATARRWFKLLGALILIGVIVQIMNMA
jgi:hypothetical protein